MEGPFSLRALWCQTPVWKKWQATNGVIEVQMGTYLGEDDNY
jgi:hypothetical protein